LSGIVKLKVNLYLVVLKSNKRERETRISTEPELKRNVKSELRDTSRSIAVVNSLRRLDSVDTTTRNNLCKSRNITNHISVTNLEARLLCKFVPDV
jgi:hypothetical protein